MRRLFCLAIVGLASCSVTTAYSKNPIIDGWYADPHASTFDSRHWIYATVSDVESDRTGEVVLSPRQEQLRGASINPHYLTQTHLSALSSQDLIDWKLHRRVLSVSDVAWAAYAMWAPAIVCVEERYYLFFSANDIQSDEELGGIGVATADSPEGPFRDAIGSPLIGQFVNGAQPIDPFVFVDEDGERYLYYGGWGHCNVAKLGATPTKLVPFDDGKIFHEITPEGYVEGSYMLKRRGVYYLMWSEGGWGGPDYSVAYAMGDSPLGPFRRVGKILQQDEAVATGAGHHSVLSLADDRHFIVYHRRPLGDTDPNHREICIEDLEFSTDGHILPVTLTSNGVDEAKLSP